MSFPTAKLGRFLKHRSEFVEIDDARGYKRLRVQLHGRGIVLRDEVDGTEIKTKKQQLVRPGDFVVAEIDAKLGGFGLVPEHLGGAIVSSHYFVFETDETVCLRGWLDAVIRSGRLEEQVAARGSTNYAAIRPNHVLEFEIPLPPLPEQRRVVARLGQIEGRVEKARSLRVESDIEVARLPALLTQRRDLAPAEKLRRGWSEVTLSEVISQRREPHRVEAHGTYPNLGIYSFGRGLFAKSPIDGARTSAKELYRVKAGQFIYSRLFAFEGAFGMVTHEFDGWFVSNEYPVFESDAERVLPEFLTAYFSSRAVWEEVAAGSKGLGDRRQRVQPEKLLGHRLLIPPLADQLRVRQVAAAVAATRPGREAQKRELEAVLAASIRRSLEGGN